MEIISGKCTSEQSTSPGSIRQATRENFEYLVATLSKRTAGKKYENYIVNAIWNALADGTLRPVTQQYVNRSVQHRGLALVDLRQERVKGENAQRALVDLYFPSLHLGVECDEAQHQESLTAQADLARTADIKRAIPDYEELRVSVEIDKTGVVMSPDAVLDQIDDVVRRIRERKAIVESGHFGWAPSGHIDWRSEKRDWELALDAGVLSAGDGFVFRHNGEIRELFGLGDGTGKKYSTFATNVDLPDNTHVVWCPKLAKQKPGGPLEAGNNAGYLNWIIVESEDVLIGQANPNPESISRRMEAIQASEKPLPPWEYTLRDEENTRRTEASDWPAPQPSEPDTNPWDTGHRITFVHTKDAVGRSGFQFLGVFTPPIGYREIDGISFSVCRLISDTVALP